MEKDQVKIDTEDNSLCFRVNPALYSLDVIFNAAYSFTKENHVFVDGDKDKEIVVELRPFDSDSDLAFLGREFSNRLLAFQDSKQRQSEDKDFRDALLGQSLMISSDASVDYLEDDSLIDDPEDIAVPWEEKYGNSDSCVSDAGGMSVPSEEKYGQGNSSVSAADTISVSPGEKDAPDNSESPTEEDNAVNNAHETDEDDSASLASDDATEDK